MLRALSNGLRPATTALRTGASRALPRVTRPSPYNVRGAAYATGAGMRCKSQHINNLTGSLDLLVVGSFAAGVVLLTTQPPAHCETSEALNCLEDIVRRADELYDDSSLRELHSFLENQHSRFPDEAEITWRFARAAHGMYFQNSTDPLMRRDYAFQAYRLASEALEQDPDNYACHKWYAVSLTTVGDFEGIKIKISNAFVIREHFETATKLNPRDATSRHLLGVWCYTFAEMPWYQLKIATALFGTPPQSTYEEALGHFEAAENIDPGFYKRNALYLAKTYQKLKRAIDFEKWVRIAISMPVVTPDDHESDDEARVLGGDGGGSALVQ